MSPGRSSPADEDWSAGHQCPRGRFCNGSVGTSFLTYCLADLPVPEFPAQSHTLAVAVPPLLVRLRHPLTVVAVPTIVESVRPRRARRRFVARLGNERCGSRLHRCCTCRVCAGLPARGAPARQRQAQSRPTSRRVAIVRRIALQCSLSSLMLCGELPDGGRLRQRRRVAGGAPPQWGDRTACGSPGAWSTTSRRRTGRAGSGARHRCPS